MKQLFFILLLIFTCAAALCQGANNNVRTVQWQDTLRPQFDPQFDSVLSFSFPLLGRVQSYKDSSYYIYDTSKVYIQGFDSSLHDKMPVIVIKGYEVYRHTVHDFIGGSSSAMPPLITFEDGIVHWYYDRKMRPLSRLFVINVTRWDW